MKKKSTYCVLLVLLMALTQSPSWAGCLDYEPTEVELHGLLIQAIYPGLPNFEDVRKGDKPEKAWVLQLPNTICVNAKPNNSLNEAENGIKMIQLVMLGDSKKIYKRLLGKNVIVRGGLFHGNNGHHHTAVLLTVKEMK